MLAFSFHILWTVRVRWKSIQAQYPVYVMGIGGIWNTVLSCVVNLSCITLSANFLFYECFGFFLGVAPSNPHYIVLSSITLSANVLFLWTLTTLYHRPHNSLMYNLCNIILNNAAEGALERHSKKQACYYLFDEFQPFYSWCIWFLSGQLMWVPHFLIWWLLHLVFLFSI